MKDQWLKCQILKGMFSDERAIVFKLSNGRTFSAFVPNVTVLGEINREGKVKVNVFQDGTTMWAVLPTEYQEAVPVLESELVNS